MVETKHFSLNGTTRGRASKRLLLPVRGTTTEPLPSSKVCEFECIALLLQGGGALGAYQGGVYEALAEAGIAPDWIGGISIGAIVGAIIAGNTPADRVRKLRGFWEHITSNPLLNEHSSFAQLLKPGGEPMRTFWGQMSASFALLGGVRDFFVPHPVPPWC